MQKNKKFYFKQTTNFIIQINNKQSPCNSPAIPIGTNAIRQDDLERKQNCQKILIVYQSSLDVFMKTIIKFGVV